MTMYVALIRGINVGGNSILPMKDLSEICTHLGFNDVRTYIQSGNVIFKTELSEDKVKEKLEQALLKKMGKPITVVVRTKVELEKILANNSFSKVNPSQVGVVFVHKKLHKDIEKEFITIQKEEIHAGKREVYIYYPEGMGKSKLKFPSSLKNGTVRNINTISKLIALMNT